MAWYTRITNEELKKIRDAVTQSLKKAQEGYNESKRYRDTAHRSAAYNYGKSKEPTISLTDANHADEIYHASKKVLLQELREIVNGLEAKK